MSTSEAQSTESPSNGTPSDGTTKRRSSSTKEESSTRRASGSGGDAHRHHHHRRVLLPVDESENSLRAVKWYIEYGRRSHDHVILFHSVDTSLIIPSMGYNLAGPVPLGNVEQLLKEKEKEVIETKKKFEQILAEAGVKGEFVYTSQFPHAGEAIIHACKERAVEYIIMGNRGMGAIRRTFLGSISDYVLHHAHVPTTIIPPPHK